MLRIIFLVAGLLVPTGSLAQVADAYPPSPSQSVQADALAEHCWELLRMDELVQIIRDEALAEAAVMQSTSFEGGGDGLWVQAVEKIHETSRVEALLREALRKALAQASPARITAALEFYAGPLGRKSQLLESSTRRMMVDKPAEDQAKADFSAAARRNDPRIEQISRMITVTDLIDLNVAGGLNAAFAFSEGVRAGGGYMMPMTDEQLVEEVWAQEPVMRADAVGWLEAFLYLAYAPLSDQELEQYTEFLESAKGRALSNAVFVAFDELYSQLAGEMGYAFAGQLQGQTL